MPFQKLKWGLPFLSALMFWASFHPLNLGFLGYLALVPLLIYAQTTSGKKSFFVAWAGGYVAFLLGYSWFAYTVPPGPWFVAVYMGLYFPLFVWLVKKLGIAWSPVAWVATEVLRSTIFGGLPWLLLGYTQHDLLYLIQIADLGGIWLVSLLVAFINMAVLHPSRAIKIAAAAAVLVSVVYGAIRVETMPLYEGPSIAVVQPNIPQSLKNEAVDDKTRADENYFKHFDPTIQAAEGKPDLIVWPEAAIYRGVYVNLDGEPRWIKTKWLARLLEPTKVTGIDTVIGLLVVEERKERQDTYTNSAVLVKPGVGIAGRYDKMHLVPFAETFDMFPRPLPAVCKYLVRLFSGLRLEAMRPGTGVEMWDLGEHRYGAQICYEAIFTEISREIARKGGAFTVNISNDGWFKASGELDQMLVMARFRSIENRIHVIRATNTGISAFIEPTGRVQSKLEVNGRCKEVGGVLAGRIRLTKSSSLFRVAGDWVAWLVLGAAAAELGRRLFIDRKNKSA
jgi:apolipoprotein N-acyltransferase